MELSTLIPALLFGLLGLILIIHSIRLILRSAFGGWDTSSWLRSRKMSRKEAALKEADFYLDKGDYLPSLKHLRQAFVLEEGSFSMREIEQIANHNLSILGRVISISEKSGSRLLNLPAVEGLLIARHQLMRSVLEIEESRYSLRLRQKEKKKSVPRWAFAEFSRKLRDIKGDLIENRKNLEPELDTLFENLSQERAADQVTYH